MDKYDAAIKYYLKNPEEISGDWASPLGRNMPHSILFGYMTHSRYHGIDDPSNIGCPAMVCFNEITSHWEGYTYNSQYVAETRTLTAEVRKIPHMPDPRTMQTNGYGVSRANLEALAEAQRLADKLLGRNNV